MASDDAGNKRRRAKFYGRSGLDWVGLSINVIFLWEVACLWAIFLVWKKLLNVFISKNYFHLTENFFGLMRKLTAGTLQ